MNRIWLKLFSVLVAIYAWVHVNYKSTDLLERTFEVPIVFVNTPEDIRATLKGPSKASVKLSGRRKDFLSANLAGKNAIFQVDLKGLKTGSYQLPVELYSIYSGLSKVSYSPEIVTIDIEEVIKKVFELEIETEGQTADGYVAEDPQARPLEITVQGTPDQINNISGCKVRVNLDGVKNSLSQDLPIELIYKPSVSGIEKSSNQPLLAPSKAIVDVVIKRGNKPKKVIVAKPNFIGSLSDGRMVEDWEIIPPEVIINGTPKQLKDIKEVYAKPVDLSKIGTDTEIQLSLETPKNGVYFSGSPLIKIRLSVSKPEKSKPAQNLAEAESEDNINSIQKE